MFKHNGKSRLVLLLTLVGLGGFGLLSLTNHHPKVSADNASVHNNVAPAAVRLAGVPQRRDYNWDVRPILSENCFRCHGSDAKARKASLRLDIPEVALAELKEMPHKYAIVPGDVDKSELVRRITSTDPKVYMPPAELHKTLSDKEITTLKTWISQGAEYKPHWSLIPPTKVSPPQTSFSGRAVNDIDRFVFARLEREGLSPSPNADRDTLINRVSLVLTGLPPTLEEVEAFRNDKSPNAYEKVVDRLLASQAYGERMASYWMDVARWAETDGFLDDRGGHLQWPYRDWVISAFNQNLPYDRFVTWQLAGDLLPNPTKEQILATSFGRLGKRSTENGNIDEEYRMEYAIDRASTVGTAFLGLTVGCARCHDHKYDPISQKDFYSLVGFFNSVPEPGFYPSGRDGLTAGPTLPWADQETEKKLAEADANIRMQEKAFAATRRSAESDVSVDVDALVEKPANEIAAAIHKSIDAATIAYFPFESTSPIPEGALHPRNRVQGPRESNVAASMGVFGSPNTNGAGANSQGQQPRESALTALVKEQAAKSAAPQGPQVAGNAKQGPSPQGAENAAAAQRTPAKPQGPPGPPANLYYPTSPLPGNWIKDKMVFSPNLASPNEPLILESPILKKGPRGNALWFDSTDKGTVYDNEIARFERTQPFGFDLWIYAGSVYKESILINNWEDGGAGYRMMLDNNVLRFELMHSRPSNMLSVAIRKPFPQKKWVHVAITYDGSSRAQGIKFYLDGEPTEVDILRNNLTLSSSPIGIGDPFDAWPGFMFGVRQKYPSIAGGGIDELRIFNRALTPIEVRYLHEEEAAVTGDREKLRRQLVEMEVENNPKVVEGRKALSETREVQNKMISVLPEIMVLGDTAKPRQGYVLLRGLYDQHGDAVQPTGLPHVLEWNDRWPRNRLGLTDWMFDPKNPLTSRVFVNRLWQLNFGRGIVETSEDFGLQGSVPTNPELLDWLAVDFMNSRWNIKRMEKMIVMSATFRQSSKSTDELETKDPGNLFLARGPRVRLPAEMIRDSALADGGLLVDKVGGPSVYPYQPDGVWIDPVGSPYPRPDKDHPDDLHRKSLYSYVKRNIPPPSMMIFDMNDRSYSSVRSNTSNTPLQALVLLDDPQFIEAYRGMATRAILAEPDTDTQIKEVYRLAIRRAPTKEEVKIMRGYYDEEKTRFEKSKDSTDKFLNIGLAPVHPGIEHAQLAAMTSVAAAVMNTPDAFTLR